MGAATTATQFTETKSRPPIMKFKLVTNKDPELKRLFDAVMQRRREFQATPEYQQLKQQQFPSRVAFLRAAHELAKKMGFC
jgi:hypothetical protein